MFSQRIFVQNDIFSSSRNSLQELSGIALGYGLDDRWFESRQNLGIFLFTTASRLALVSIQIHVQCVPGALSVGEKRQGSESDHSPPTSAEVKNTWSYTSSPQYVFMACYSVKTAGTTLEIYCYYGSRRYRLSQLNPIYVPQTISLSNIHFIVTLTSFLK
jgi:hypothetical protein